MKVYKIYMSERQLAGLSKILEEAELTNQAVITDCSKNHIYDATYDKAVQKGLIIQRAFFAFSRPKRVLHGRKVRTINAYEKYFDLFDEES